MDEANDGLMSIFAEFAVCKENAASPDSNEAQALVLWLRAIIISLLYTTLALTRFLRGLATCMSAMSD